MKCPTASKSTIKHKCKRKTKRKLNSLVTRDPHLISFQRRCLHREISHNYLPFIVNRCWQRSNLDKIQLNQESFQRHSLWTLWYTNKCMLPKQSFLRPSIQVTLRELLRLALRLSNNRSHRVSLINSKGLKSKIKTSNSKRSKRFL